MATGTVDLTPDPSTIQVKDLAPDPSTIKAVQPPSKSIKAVKAIAHGAPIVGQEPWLLRDIQAPGRAVSSTLARGKPSPMETPKQEQADLDALIHRLGPVVTPLMAMNQLSPGLARFALSMGLDPTTYLGGSGLLAKGATKAALKMAPLIAKGAERAPALEHLFEYFVYGGKLKTDLAKLFGRDQAATLYAHARAAKAIGKAAAETPKEQGEAAMQEFASRVKPHIDDMLRAVEGNKRTKAYRMALAPIKEKVAGLNNAAADFFSAEPQGLVSHMRQHPLGDAFFGSMKRVADVPKQILVGSSPLRHGQNISFLQALHYPLTLPKAAIDFGRAMLSSDVRESIEKDLAKQGLHSGAEAESSQFTKWLHGLPLVVRMGGGAALGGYSAHQQGANPLMGMAAGAVAGGVAPKWYDASTKILWTLDSVLKHGALRASALTLIKKGLPEADAWARAAKDVGDRLVNYDEASPFIKDLRHFAPFATWQIKSVGSILRGLSEHPERALAVLRSYPAAGGELQKTGDVRVIKTKGSISKKTGIATRPHVKRERLGAATSTPLAELARRFADPAAWARAASSTPYQALAGAAEMALTHSQHPYSTYGKPPLQWLLEGLTQAPGMPSAFGDPFVDQTIYGQTGINQRALPKP